LNRSNQKPSIPFRPDIEGLRALAVGLVIASHAGLPFLRGGFVGVDVFFVLSGYLITRLLMEEISSSGTVNFARFYARRARRLLPADHDGVGCLRRRMHHHESAGTIQNTQSGTCDGALLQ
jgi:peptidoglycan/LPS O-acetylase OafA/YrhL